MEGRGKETQCPGQKHDGKTCKNNARPSDCKNAAPGELVLQRQAGGTRGGISHAACQAASGCS
eukprot:9077987-Lingulodinium_polyedra.AAC.1